MDLIIHNEKIMDECIPDNLKDLIVNNYIDIESSQSLSVIEEDSKENEPDTVELSKREETPRFHGNYSKNLNLFDI